VLLLLIFYIATSLLQHRLAGTLQRRLLVEYSLLGGGVAGGHSVCGVIVTGAGYQAVQLLCDSPRLLYA
ncbi:MAG: hypothetical protein HC914_11295, partial [Chloroflexaceae bacterium]|nr:hypothetical protein [Chloroflexaceae bacterium]